MLAHMDQPEPFAPERVAFTEAEIAGIAAAQAGYKARGGVPLEAVAAWLDSLETDRPLLTPQPRKS